MSLTAEQLVRRIHDAPARIVLAVAGGGSRAIAALLEVPGASRTLLEAVVPYCEQAMVQWLGGRPERFCSEPTARAIAMAAYRRACQLDEGPARAGVACTASLASDRPKRGPHRTHLAIQTATVTMSQSLELEKGRRSRGDEERLVSRLVLNAIAEACGLESRVELELFPGERIDEARVVACASWQELVGGSVEAVREGGSGEAESEAARAVFPGAFHPLHAGHRRMAEIARKRLGAPVAFEISIFNVDKLPLDYVEIARRLEQFGRDQVVWLTRAATFDEKSARFPGATFVVGSDTMRRIAEPCYYDSDPAACRAALGRILARGCRFLVFGRQQSGRFVGLAGLDLPPELKAACEEVPADEFREDVSSTDIRLAENG